MQPCRPFLQRFDSLLHFSFLTFPILACPVYREKESEKNVPAEAEMKAKKCSCKSQESESQRSALWEVIGTQNKSLLVFHIHLYNCFAYTSKSILLRENIHMQTHTQKKLSVLFLQNYFARNFYNMRLLALFVAFAINFILLFYKVSAVGDILNYTTFVVA